MKFSGVVVGGGKRGEKLGFSTANLEVNLGLEPGVYAALVSLHGDELPAAVFYNISAIGKPRCEVHILDYAGNLYGRTLDVEIVGGRVSEIERCLSDDELRKKISKDIERVKYVLGNH